ncbi:MAG: Na/Pi cotransporter family protein, partial [Alistipes sp.]|nr:Na/Pi cotransporter family protein [Alistipes sp.]
MILQIFTFLGSLGMFLYGMNMMSSGLQKTAGERLRGILASMTSSTFKGILTGVGITSVIQSSSATTVMVVGFVNAGLLTLIQAIGVIMGANIGTTVTAWLVSWLGFKADISILAIPLMALGFILSIAKSERRKNMSEFVIGFALLFLGLSMMKEAMPDLRETPEVLSFITRWTEYGFGSVLIFLAIGTVLTLVLQSSSATMALTLIMLSMGWIPFQMAAAMVLGENIGTTITANLAAMIGTPNARRAALAHTVFNVFGVCWALIFFTPFLKLVGLIIEAFGLPNPLTVDYSAANLSEADSTAVLYGTSMLHT